MHTYANFDQNIPHCSRVVSILVKKNKPVPKPKDEIKESNLATDFTRADSNSLEGQIIWIY